VTFYLFGAALSANQKTIARLRNSRLILAGPIVLGLLICGFMAVGPERFLAEDKTVKELIFFSIIPPLSGLLMAAFVMFDGTKDSRPSKLAKPFTKSAYTIYLVHYPIILTGATVLLNFKSPAIVKFALLAISTFVLSYLVDYLIVRRSSIAAFLLNGSRTRTIVTVTRTVGQKTPVIEACTPAPTEP
jgi:peptidoglycan/LPS O-acetylase OafA/YrhL